LAEGISAAAANLLKLIQGLTGVEMGFAGIVNNVNALNTKMLQVTYNLGGFSDGFKDVTAKVNALSDSFNYTQGAVSNMIQTLGTGFRKPITDMGEIELILKRSQALFGANENAAQKFIDQLSRIDQAAGPLRDTYTELQKLIQKVDQGTATDAEIQKMKELRSVTEVELGLKLRDREITLEQYNQTMATLKAESDMSAASVQGRKVALSLSKDINAAQSANVAATRAQIEFMNQYMDSVGKFMGVAYSGGSQVVGGAIRYISGAVKEYGKEGDSGVQRMLGKDDNAKKAMQEAIESAKKEHGFDIDEGKVKEKLKSDLISSGSSEAEAQKAVDMIFKQVSAMDVLRDAIVNVKAAKDAYNSEEYKAQKASEEAAKAAQNELDMAKIRVGALGQQYKYMSDILASQTQSLGEMEILNARIGKSYNYSEAAASALEFEKALISQRENLTEQLELQKKINEEASRKLSDAKSEEAKNAALQSQQKTLKQIAEIQAQINGLADQGLARINAINQGFDKRASFIRAELDYQKQLISLQDNFAVGISANAAAREKAAKLAIDEANNEKERIKALQVELAQKRAANSSASEIRDTEMKITEAKTRHLALTKEALDATQKMREGYLDAIDSMQSGAGMFTEIVADQNKSLGALVRTTEEMPRVLRTGAGSGGILQAGQFGPGGITGGFDPNSPEYSRHVIRNMDDVKSLLVELPKQMGEEVGTRLGWAAKGREEFGGQIAGSAAPGEAGTIAAGSSTAPGVPATGGAPTARSGGSDSAGSPSQVAGNSSSGNSGSSGSAEGTTIGKKENVGIDQMREAPSLARLVPQLTPEEMRKKREDEKMERDYRSLGKGEQGIRESQQALDAWRQKIKDLESKREERREADPDNQVTQDFYSKKILEAYGAKESWEKMLDARQKEQAETKERLKKYGYDLDAPDGSKLKFDDEKSKPEQKNQDTQSSQDSQSSQSSKESSKPSGASTSNSQSSGSGVLASGSTPEKTYTAQEHREALSRMMADITNEIHVGVVSAVRTGMSKAMKELAVSTS
jgi:hypothetical protein